MSVNYGLGQHQADISIKNTLIASKYCFLAAIIYIVLSYLVKVIVGLFLARICSGMYIGKPLLSLKLHINFSPKN